MQTEIIYDILKCVLFIKPWRRNMKTTLMCWQNFRDIKCFIKVKIIWMAKEIHSFKLCPRGSIKILIEVVVIFIKTIYVCNKLRNFISLFHYHFCW